MAQSMYIDFAWGEVSLFFFKLNKIFTTLKR
jgi:hypothetical protein